MFVLRQSLKLWHSRLPRVAVRLRALAHPEALVHMQARVRGNQQRKRYVCTCASRDRLKMCTAAHWIRLAVRCPVSETNCLVSYRFANALRAELAQLTAECEDAVSMRAKEQAAGSIQAHWRGCVGRRKYDKMVVSRRQEMHRTLASLQAELEMLNATVEATRPVV